VKELAFIITLGLGQGMNGDTGQGFTVGQYSLSQELWHPTESTTLLFSVNHESRVDSISDYGSDSVMLQFKKRIE
jgi:hypothetical protein